MKVVLQRGVLFLVGVSLFVVTLVYGTTYKKKANVGKLGNGSSSVAKGTDQCVDVPRTESSNEIFFVGCGGFF